jgi:Fanconi anemia group M protein
MPDKVLTTIKPRKYQQEIYENCKDKNCLVILPTGIGKTLVALMLSIYTQKKHPGTKTLFLAPTRPLAQQHLDYFKKHLPELFAHMELFTGKINSENRRKLWERADIVFSTPQCIGNDLKNKLYTLSEVSLLIEDECHRCLKNYSYTYVAEIYKEQRQAPQILGLTASPGTDKETIKKIANNLGIETIELRTRESEDVKEYLQELKFEAIYIEFPEEFKKITEIIKKLYEKKVEELKNRKLLFKPANKITLLEVQGNIMKAIYSGNKNFNFLSGASACAQAIKLSHLSELIQTQTLHTAHNYIQEMFKQAEQKKSKAVQQIVKNPEFNQAYIKINELLAKNIEHPKLLELKSIIEESIKENSKTKIIVFSQYRETGTRICKELNQIQGINARVFVGQAKKTDEKGVVSGLNQKEQHEVIEKFKQGEINVLISTSIGEEGLDIPEVNAVIFYEPIPSAIRKIQRAGRTARLMKGRLIILITKNTLDEIFYYASKAKEKRMYNAIESVKQDLDAGISLKDGKLKPQETEGVLGKEKQERLF